MYYINSDNNLNVDFNLFFSILNVKINLKIYLFNLILYFD